ncbi:MAG: hypothetical protein JWO58_1772, partial [Chitinophagaceae bacterium]|nr:hypothetical protein [Chitinophagaceae bacterium]
MVKFFYVLWTSTVFLLFSEGACGQTAGVVGTIKDEGNVAIELANVILLRLPDSTEAGVTLSDSLGVYKFEKVVPGKYTLAVLQIGFKKAMTSAFEVGDSTIVSLDVIMKSEYKESGVVMVRGQRPIVRQEADKMVVS